MFEAVGAATSKPAMRSVWARTASTESKRAPTGAMDSERAAEPSLARVERWMARRIVETVRQELAETREELSADLATLVELTVELERIAARLEATGARDTA